MICGSVIKWHPVWPRETEKERARERGRFTGLVPYTTAKTTTKNHSPQLVRRETICCLTFSPQNVKFIFIMAPPACHHNYSCTTHDCVSLSDRLSLSVYLSVCLSVYMAKFSRTRLACDFPNLRLFSHSAAALKRVAKLFCFVILF